MAELYEGNGDYSSHNEGSSDFKRKSGNSNDKDEEHEEDGPKLNEKANEYIRELLSERVSMERKYPCADRLIENGEFYKVFQLEFWKYVGTKFIFVLTLNQLPVFYHRGTLGDI